MKVLISLGRWRPPPFQGKSFQRWSPYPSCITLQSPQRNRPNIWFSYSIRWWKVYWFRFDLWFWSRPEEIRSTNPNNLFFLRLFMCLRFSHTIEKFVSVFRVRLRNLLDNNGNRGRIGVRSSGELIKRRPPVWIRRARNRRRIYCCGSHLFMSFYSIGMSIWNNTDSWRTTHLNILWTSAHSSNLKPAIIRVICVYVLGYRFYIQFNG